VGAHKDQNVGSEEVKASFEKLVAEVERLKALLELQALKIHMLESTAVKPIEEQSPDTTNLDLNSPPPLQE
jgi:hypothetical protein